MFRINILSPRLSVFHWFYFKYYLYLFLSPFFLETAGIIGCASILLCYLSITSLEFSPPSYVEFQTLPK